MDCRPCFFACCLCPSVSRLAESRAPRQFPVSVPRVKLWGDSKSSHRGDFPNSAVCCCKNKRRGTTEKQKGDEESWLSSAWDSFSRNFSTGVLLAALAAGLLNVGVFTPPAFCADLSVTSVAVFRGLPDIEEGMKLQAKQLEATVDSVVDSLSSNDKNTKESKVYEDLIQEVWEVVDQNYLDARDTGFDRQQWLTLKKQALDKKPGNRPAVYRAIREMLAQGLRDPYTRLLPPEEFSAMRKYDMTGVGMNIGTADEFVKKTASQLPEDRNSEGGVWVMGLLKDSSAYNAGIQQGDQILEIDGISLDSITPFKAAAMIKGDGSTMNKVKLKIRRVKGELVDIGLERQPVKIPSPVSSTFQTIRARKLGFIQLTSFNARAQEELLKTIHDLEGQGATELVLDLRDNRGGLVQEGVEVAKVFLDGQSTIVITEESSSKVLSPVVSVGPPITRLPLTVLVNQNTASASEILAGALKDNCRAVLAGSQTFGKGLIQSVYALSDGSGLVLTVGKYLTPGMVDIDREGIQPDFKRIPSVESAEEFIKACKVQKRAIGGGGQMGV